PLRNKPNPVRSTFHMAHVLPVRRHRSSIIPETRTDSKRTTTAVYRRMGQNRTAPGEKCEAARKERQSGTIGTRPAGTGPCHRTTGSTSLSLDDLGIPAGQLDLRGPMAPLPLAGVLRGQGRQQMLHGV